MTFRVLVSLALALTMRPGVRYRDRRWKFIAATRRALDDRRCAQCRVRGVILDVHHKREVRHGGSHWLWNLRTVCRGCHERIHGRSF